MSPPGAPSLSWRFGSEKRGACIILVGSSDATSGGLLCVGAGSNRRGDEPNRRRRRSGHVVRTLYHTIRDTTLFALCRQNSCSLFGRQTKKGGEAVRPITTSPTLVEGRSLHPRERNPVPQK